MMIEEAPKPIPSTRAAVFIGELSKGSRVVPIHALYEDEDCSGSAVALAFGALGTPEMFIVSMSFLSSLVVELSGESVQ